MDRKSYRDHREIAEELRLFYIDESIGKGLAMWLPKGATIRRVLERYMTDLEIAHGYQHVITPNIAKLDIYKKSGHWEHYHHDMFTPMVRDNEEYVLRPMNCPHHIALFNSVPRSYKELPMRIAEFGTIYRFENSGELMGLMRVRAMQLNDSHIFCSREQLVEEFVRVIKLIKQVYQDLGIKNFWYRLSLHDQANKEKYPDNPHIWEMSENALREALKTAGVTYKETVGDAAFYGPKLDVQFVNALGKDETVSTAQIDFYLPKKFDLSYIGQDGNQHEVIMIHRAIISTLERMIAFLIEQYQGSFPLWLSPVQVVVLPIADRHTEYAKNIHHQLLQAGMRSELDTRGERLQAKIRDATLQKVPYMSIIGDKELASNNDTISIRTRRGEDIGQMSLITFIKKVQEEIDKKA